MRCKALSRHRFFRLSLWRGAFCAALVVTPVLLAADPASARVTCFVRKTGSMNVTYFCQDGYQCDNEGQRCVPGPAIERKVKALLDESKRIYRDMNRDWTKKRGETESKALGNVKNQTFIRWDGNPRIIPTPRYRPYFGGLPAADSNVAGPAPAEPKAASTGDSDAVFCAFIARKIARGELVPSSDVPVPSVCNAAIEAAKTCKEPGCAPADWAAELDKQARTVVLPWGSADQEAIDVLVRTGQ